MKQTRYAFSLLCLVVLMGAFHAGFAQERGMFSLEEIEKAKAQDKEDSQQNAQAPIPVPTTVLGCNGPISQVIDVGFEGLKVTAANYFALPGGGEGGGFDKTPVLSTRVRLEEGMCLNAHLSAIVGSRQTYGVAPLTLFQVTLTPAGGGPRHMVGHYERPYGSGNGPAVALEAERDVDMYASNFFQRVGTGLHEVPPGVYRVDAWWSGNGPGGAIGAAFVLKLYVR